MGISTTKMQIINLAKNSGAADVGVCRIDELRGAFHFELAQSTRGLNTGIAIAVSLSKAVLDTVAERPNQIYKAHYLQVNNILNDIAYRVSAYIQYQGARALPIPASHMISWRPIRAHLSHREIAYKAGLGWRGRNNLLINPAYGSQYRLVTVLTDLELEPDELCQGSCGECRACLEVCPAGAIGEKIEDFNLEACYNQIHKFALMEDMGHHICGICLKVCDGQRPYGG